MNLVISIDRNRKGKITRIGAGEMSDETLAALRQALDASYADRTRPEPTVSLLVFESIESAASCDWIIRRNHLTGVLTVCAAPISLVL